MQKQILFGLAAAALLTACSQDEAVDRMVDDSNLIKVGVNVAGNSRAANSYCDHILPTNFYLTSAHVGENAPNKGYYFKDVEMTVSSNGKATFSDGSDRYWPDNTLLFFGWHTTQDGVTAEYGTRKLAQAIIRQDSTMILLSENGASSGATLEVADSVVEYVMTLKGFTVPEDVTKQADLIVASKSAQKGSDVKIEFEHALSQVVFNAKCENTSINVKVWEIGFAGLYNTGDCEVVSVGESAIRDTDMGSEMMTLYGLSISDQMSSQIGGLIKEPQTKCYWNVVEGSTPTHEYMIEMGESGVDLTPDLKVLTSAPVDTMHAPKKNEDGSLDWSNWSQVLQLIPQQTIYKVITGENGKLSSGYKINRANGVCLPINTVDTGYQVYLKVCCDILAPNEKTDGLGQTYATLFSGYSENGEKQYIYIPVQIKWMPGYRYVYTLNFSPDGNGGIINPEDPDPDPVLKNLNIKVTVNEYSDGGESVAGYETVSDTILDELVNMPR